MGVKNKKGSIYLILIAIIFLITVSGIGYAIEKSDTQSVRTQIDEKLEILKTSYETPNVQDIMSLFDKDFTDREEAEKELSHRLYNYKYLELDFFVNRFLSDDDNVYVYLNWNKVERDEENNFSKSQGGCKFIFKKKEDGDITLLEIDGQNPFF